MPIGTDTIQGACILGSPSLAVLDCTERSLQGTAPWCLIAVFSSQASSIRAHAICFFVLVVCGILRYFAHKHPASGVPLSLGDSATPRFPEVEGRLHPYENPCGGPAMRRIQLNVCARSTGAASQADMSSEEAEALATTPLGHIARAHLVESPPSSLLAEKLAEIGACWSDGIRCNSRHQKRSMHSCRYMHMRLKCDDAS